MPENNETPTRADRLKEAVKQMNGQTDRTINLLTETVISLMNEVEDLKSRSIRTVHKVTR